LPPALDGLILGGGFPEVFAEELSQNKTMRRAIAQHIANGLPTYAECGGLMYLCQTLVDFEGRAWPMAGTLPATTTMTGKLTLGYRQVTAQHQTSLVIPGQVFWGHEFHRSAIAPASHQPLYAATSYPLPNSPARPLPDEGWSCHNLHASYVHTHWGTQTDLPRRFLDHCLHQPRVSH
ncbi:MAG: cobyrinic acid a,c-diamide synthase, partial [Cyanobacteria bacterium P01_H01_bin.58]